MKQFIKFEAQYYLDDHSFYTVKVMEPEKAEAYIKYMNSVWSGGYYYPEYHVMTDVEALVHAKAVIKEEMLADLDDSAEIVTKVLTELKECYGIEYNSNN